MKNEKRLEEDFKPRTWLLVIMIVLALGITVVLVNKVIEDKKKKDAEVKETVNDFTNNIFDKIKEQQEKTTKEDDEWDKKMFNSEFETYAGTKSKFFVLILIDNVIKNNKTNNEHVITVINGDINTSEPEEIRNIKQNLDDYH